MNDNTFDVYRLPSGNILCDTGDTGLIEHDAFGVPGRGHVDLAEGAVKLIPESEGLEPLLATNRRLHEEIRQLEVGRAKGVRRYEAAEEKCKEWFDSYERVMADLEALRGELADAKRAKSVFGENLDAATARAKSNQAALREALTLIAKDGCENLTTASGCIGDTDRKRGAPYTAESWCFPCVAKDALSAATSTPPTLPDRMRAAADVLEEADAQKYGDDKVGSWTAAGLRINANAFEVEDRERAETEQRVDEVADVIRRSDTMTDPKVGTRVADVYAARALLAEYVMTPKAVGE